MTREAYDGHQQQAGLDKPDLVGRYPDHSIAGLREMVVIAAFYRDEKGNRSRSYTEYTLRELNTPEFYYGARVIAGAFGLQDGTDDTLHPAMKPLPGAMSSVLALTTPAKDSDGDRVLVGFIEGSRTRPVILGVLGRTGVTYSGTRADGERRFTTHKGTSVTIRKTGEYEVKRALADGTFVSVVIKEDGDVEITGPTAKKFKVNYAGADSVHLGENTTHHALLGEFVQDIFNAFVGAFNSHRAVYVPHFHLDSSGLPTSTPTGTPAPNLAFDPLLPPGPTNPVNIATPGESSSDASEMPDEALSEVVMLR